MSNLPVEIWDHIFDLCDFETLKATRTLQSQYVRNKTMFTSINECLVNNGPVVNMKWLFGRYRPEQFDDIEIGAKTSIELFKFIEPFWSLDYDDENWSWGAFNQACKQCNIPLVKYMMEKGLVSPEWYCFGTASLELLVYLKKHNVRIEPSELYEFLFESGSITVGNLQDYLDIYPFDRSLLYYCLSSDIIDEAVLKHLLTMTIDADDMYCYNLIIRKKRPVAWKRAKLYQLYKAGISLNLRQHEAYSTFYSMATIKSFGPQYVQTWIKRGLFWDINVYIRTVFDHAKTSESVRAAFAYFDIPIKYSEDMGLRICLCDVLANIRQKKDLWKEALLATFLGNIKGRLQMHHTIQSNLLFESMEPEVMIYFIEHEYINIHDPLFYNSLFGRYSFVNRKFTLIHEYIAYHMNKYQFPYIYLIPKLRLNPDIRLKDMVHLIWRVKEVDALQWFIRHMATEL